MTRSALRPAPHWTERAVTVRAIRPADRDALRTFYADLSDESRRTRFFGLTDGIGLRQATDFCSPDHDHREGFVAVMAGDESGPTALERAERIVGHVCLEPDGPGVAEVAVAVADAAQHHGIGRRLVEAAIGWAQGEGLTHLSATMLADNPPIARLLTSLGLPSRTCLLGADIVSIRIALPVGPASGGVDGSAGGSRSIGPFGPCEGVLRPLCSNRS